MAIYSENHPQFLSDSPKKQKGVTLIFSMLILSAVLLASVGIIRAVNTSGLVAGSLSSNSRCTAAARLALDYAIQQFNMGAVLNEGDLLDPTPATGASNQPSKNYYATNQAITNTFGVPDLIFNGTLTANQTVSGGNTLTHMIERLCLDQGPVKAERCQIANQGKAVDALKLATSMRYLQPVYRVTARADCPRGGRVFAQAWGTGQSIAAND